MPRLYCSINIHSVLLVTFDGKHKWLLIISKTSGASINWRIVFKSRMQLKQTISWSEWNTMLYQYYCTSCFDSKLVFRFCFSRPSWSSFPYSHCDNALGLGIILDCMNTWTFMTPRTLESQENICRYIFKFIRSLTIHKHHCLAHI